MLQHGRPYQVIDMGETELDHDTFNEYIDEMRQMYTADKVSATSELAVVADGC